MLTIGIDTARRFILGKQGLWPGRRWRGIAGAEQAMRAIEYLQLDPLQIIARSHDIKLYSRVLDYTPGMWEELAYQQRQFFDWGGWLAVRPMDELPHWRVVMRRERAGNERLGSIAAEHADAIEEMRSILRERGTVSNRDFKMETRTRTHSYRGRKDSALALYYLWMVGEVMTHHRERFERVYALTESVAPEHLLCESDEDQANRFLIKKDISF
ncbi:MAG TPA: crosslink repair DNA glycosylase YcaQ family protein, partial [Roseiflexaceae bacterium]|nr:crosslink repair DNA glycosylase YcaQ family protein [Roseiflexaceae bacterium]